MAAQPMVRNPGRNARAPEREKPIPAIIRIQGLANQLERTITWYREAYAAWDTWFVTWNNIELLDRQKEGHDGFLTAATSLENMRSKLSDAYGGDIETWHARLPETCARLAGHVSDYVAAWQKFDQAFNGLAFREQFEAPEKRKEVVVSLKLHGMIMKRSADGIWRSLLNEIAARVAELKELVGERGADGKGR